MLWSSMHSLEQHTQVYGEYRENSMGIMTFQLVLLPLEQILGSLTPLIT